MGLGRITIELNLNYNYASPQVLSVGFFLYAKNATLGA